MDIGHFNFLNNNNKDKNDNFITEFLESLKKTVEQYSKSINSQHSNTLSENSIYVITDINDKKLSLTDINNGQEIEISVDFAKKNNTYIITKEDFSCLDLGKFLTVKNNSINLLEDNVKIENNSVALKLGDMFFCLQQEKDAIYSVTEISDNKIFLTDTKEGGFFSIPKEIYPDFKTGDLLKKVNGKYILIS